MVATPSQLHCLAFSIDHRSVTFAVSSPSTNSLTYGEDRKKVHARAPTCASKGENERARTRERERESERENGGQTASE